MPMFPLMPCVQLNRPMHLGLLVQAWIGLMLICGTTAAPARADLADAEGIEFFERKIRPLLVQHCYECHSAEAKVVHAGLRVDSTSGLQRGGDSGPLIDGDQPLESLLLSAIEYQGVYDMPPAGKLPARARADIRRWLELGAPLPVDAATGEVADGDQTPRQVDLEAGRQFWAFQPAKRRPLPNLRRHDWPQRRIDAFILARLEAAGLSPAPLADRRTLARRAYVDLTGLPPTPAQLAAFERDESPEAYPQLIERLLAAPEYGQRWARHWLDLTRYAEDNPTSEKTCPPPKHAHTYRDWVIDALNNDLPYHEFVRRQLAADLIAELPWRERAATGFLGLSPVYHKEPKLSRDVILNIVADEWDERLDTVTRSLLGLTVACARCHDHKFDPIRTDDYYALAGVMASTQLVEWPLEETSLEVANLLTQNRDELIDVELRLSYARQMRKTAEREGEPTDPFQPLIEQLQARLAELKEHQKQLYAGPIAHATRDAGLWIDGSDPDYTALDFRTGQPRDLPIFVRGNVQQWGPVVPRRFLEVLSDSAPQPFQQGSGRLELANEIVGTAGSLAARVIVNRVWGWHFIQPLVRTPSNFGALGDPPSHPELLDDLTARFMEQGWSLKWLHREIMLSAAYQQSSIVPEPSAGAVDPSTLDADNRLLWRMNRRRLEPEAWRDAVLLASGALDCRMRGPSFDLNDDAETRRAVYGRVSRQTPADLLTLFDFPDAKQHAETRTLTATPLQQLYLLNSTFALRYARRLADAACRAASDQGDVTAGVEVLFRRILLRRPSQAELRAARNLLTSNDAPRPEDWQLVAHGLLASNEFLFVD